MIVDCGIYDAGIVQALGLVKTETKTGEFGFPRMREWGLRPNAPLGRRVSPQSLSPF
jgi:hypothetical protein